MVVVCLYFLINLAPGQTSGPFNITFFKFSILYLFTTSGNVIFDAIFIGTPNSLIQVVQFVPWLLGESLKALQLTHPPRSHRNKTL